MKPPRFQYCAPRLLDEALDLLNQCGPDAKILAGGQSLMPLLNMRLAAPAYLVDINHLSALDYVTPCASYLSIGAVTRQRHVEHSALVQQRHPLLVDAIQHIGHMQIRNRGTVAGSIAHADPAAELPALLTCLGGEVVVYSTVGERVIKAEEFFLDYLTTVLEPHELLTEVRFPWLPPQAGWAFMELARRSGDYALAGAVCVLTSTPTGQCLSARVSYFGISAVPVRAHTVEHLLVGTELDDQVLAAAAEAAIQGVSNELGDMHATPAYRKVLTAELTKRVLQAAWQQCKTSSEGV